MKNEDKASMKGYNIRLKGNTAGPRSAVQLTAR